MPDKDFFYFEKLKDQLVKKMIDQYPGVNSDISQWKGKEIQLFQEDLEKSVNGRISEKWFYTHLKSNSDKLPRVDILDLLCQYLGQESWLCFKRQNVVPNRKRNWSAIKIVATILLLVLGYFLFNYLKSREYAISVVDAYSNQIISADQLHIVQLFRDQSPQQIQKGEDGFYHINITSSEIQIVISAPYYHADTIVRKTLRLNDHEIFRLFPNDYAMMIHYFSNSDSEDWMRRRGQLSEIIADNARIFQVNEGGQMALEMYTKQSFINKLTIPSKSLRNIEILDIRFEGDQISQLRFMQKKGGNDE